MGRVINSIHDGRTNQIILVEKATILSVFWVSIYIQIIAKTETNGMDAKVAPTTLLLFDISDIATIRIVVIAILTM